MEKRFQIKKIKRSTKTNELLVYRSISSEDEIRFYFNDYQYVAALDEQNGNMFIHYGEDEEKMSVQKREKVLEIFKCNYKEYFLCILIFSCIYILSTILSIFLGDKSIIAGLLIPNLGITIGLICCILVIEYRLTLKSVKSKHAAEHMMINFLQKNLRLPRSMDEIKCSSRFNKLCGSRYNAHKITEFIKPFIIIECALIITLPFEIVLRLKYDVTSLSLIIMMFFAISTYILYKMDKCGKLIIITDKLELVLNYLIQYCNTTKKVKETDILLAYYAAKYWMQVVYPEYYIEDDGEFEREKFY